MNFIVKPMYIGIADYNGRGCYQNCYTYISMPIYVCYLKL